MLVKNGVKIMHKCTQESLLTEIRNDIKTLLQRTARHEVKAGVWGLIGGMIPVIITIAIVYFNKPGG